MSQIAQGTTFVDIEGIEDVTAERFHWVGCAWKIELCCLLSLVEVDV